MSGRLGYVVWKVRERGAGQCGEGIGCGGLERGEELKC